MSRRSKSDRRKLKEEEEAEVYSTFVRQVYDQILPLLERCPAECVLHIVAMDTASMVGHHLNVPMQVEVVPREHLHGFPERFEGLLAARVDATFAARSDTGPWYAAIFKMPFGRVEVSSPVGGGAVMVHEITNRDRSRVRMMLGASRTRPAEG